MRSNDGTSTCLDGPKHNPTSQLASITCRHSVVQRSSQTGISSGKQANPISIMSAFSLRSPSSRERFDRFLKAYTTHRPLVQRVLNIAFVFYVLGTTYYGLSGKPSDQGAKQKKGQATSGQQGGETGKPPRVAVSKKNLSSLVFTKPKLTSSASGRFLILPALL
jgi:hypothetical protein